MKTKMMAHIMMCYCFIMKCEWLKSTSLDWYKYELYIYNIHNIFIVYL